MYIHIYICSPISLEHGPGASDSEQLPLGFAEDDPGPPRWMNRLPEPGINAKRSARAWWVAASR